MEKLESGFLLSLLCIRIFFPLKVSERESVCEIIRQRSLSTAMGNQRKLKPDFVCDSVAIIFKKFCFLLNIVDFH